MKESKFNKPKYFRTFDLIKKKEGEIKKLEEEILELKNEQVNHMYNYIDDFLNASELNIDEFIVHMKDYKKQKKLEEQNKKDNLEALNNYENEITNLIDNNNE